MSYLGSDYYEVLTITDDIAAIAAPVPGEQTCFIIGLCRKAPNQDQAVFAMDGQYHSDVSSSSARH